MFVVVFLVVFVVLVAFVAFVAFVVLVVFVVVVVVVFVRGQRRCNVYVHTTLRMQQSLRLIELITCVMSSYPGLKEATHRLLPPPDPHTCVPPRSGQPCQ